ncbi:MAG: ATP-binding cassette domain-containing protein [Gammaproteobacteria bacterium]|nr:ATP-binding cassette domain-containing protein [Gammaproteobacteria bacterium]
MEEHNQKTVIKVKELVTHYGSRKILDGVNLDVKKNEIMVIMGGSGSGKSTLLRHVLGLNSATSGSIEILGTEITTANQKKLYQLRRNMGVAFQGGALFGSMTVGENVELPLREHTNLDEKTMRIMVRMKLEVMNLAGVEALMPSELSGGMVKRAALARAVIMDPTLLFFDEPSAGLDPVVSAELDELIILLRNAMNMTIVVVTHELESAFKIADRITILDEGKIIITDTVENIRNSNLTQVQDMLNRRPRQKELDTEAYLDRLTGDRLQ